MAPFKKLLFTKKKKKISFRLHKRVRNAVQDLKEASNDRIIQNHQGANQLDQNCIQPTATNLQKLFISSLRLELAYLGSFSQVWTNV